MGNKINPTRQRNLPMDVKTNVQTPDNKQEIYTKGLDKNFETFCFLIAVKQPCNHRQLNNSLRS